MPDIKEGLTTGPDTGMSDEARAEQALTRVSTSASHNIEEHAAAEAARAGDPTRAFTPRSLLDPDLAPTVASGITTANDPDAVARRLRAENEAWYQSPEGQAVLAEGEARRSVEHERAQRLDDIERAWMVEQFQNAESDSDRAGIFFDSDEGTKALILSSAYGIEPGDQADPDLLDFAKGDLDYLRDLYVQERREIAEQHAQAQTVAAQMQAAAERVTATNELLTSRGFAPNDPRGQAWIASLEQVAMDAGVNLGVLDGRGYAEAIRGAEATIQEAVRATEEQAFKASFFEPDTKISSGLTKLGSDGHYHRTDEVPNIRPQINAARIDAALAGGVRGETAEDIQRGVLGLDNPAKADYDRVMAEGKRLQGEYAAHAAELARSMRGGR